MNQDELKVFLQAKAARKCWCDDTEDFNPCDYSGGNFDDAYYGGQEDGEALLARELIAKLFPTTPE